MKFSLKQLILFVSIASPRFFDASIRFLSNRQLKSMDSNMVVFENMSDDVFGHLVVVKNATCGLKKEAIPLIDGQSISIGSSGGARITILSEVILAKRQCDIEVSEGHAYLIDHRYQPGCRFCGLITLNGTKLFNFDPYHPFISPSFAKKHGLKEIKKHYGPLDFFDTTNLKGPMRRELFDGDEIEIAEAKIRVQVQPRRTERGL